MNMTKSTNFDLKYYKHTLRHMHAWTICRSGHIAHIILYSVAAEVQSVLPYYINLSTRLYLVEKWRIRLFSKLLPMPTSILHNFNASSLHVQNISLIAYYAYSSCLHAALFTRNPTDSGLQSSIMRPCSNWTQMTKERIKEKAFWEWYSKGSGMHTCKSVV